MKIKTVIVIFAFVVGGFIMSGCLPKVTPTVSPSEQEPGFIITGIKNLTKVAQITGKDSINHTDQYAVYGTDEGTMVEMDGKIYMAFGDTFSESLDPITGEVIKNKWRSNVMAVSSDNNPSDGLHFDTMITDEAGDAKELILSLKNMIEVSAIPESGYSIDGKLYLTFQSIKTWGEPLGMWYANYGGVARSDDQGKTFTKLNQLKWMTTSNFAQPSCFIKDDVLYMWSTPAGRFGSVKLMKVATDSVEEFDQYRYYAGLSAGKPMWSPNEEDAIVVVPGPIGEMSFIWNEDLERWIMTYINPTLPWQLELREGLTPWGPWSDPLVLVKDSDYHEAYGSYMNTKFIENDGKKIYFAMSLWEPYNVFWMSFELEIK